MGVSVNQEKRVTQPWVCGKGAKKRMEGWYGEEGQRKEFKAEAEARYLGPRISIEGTGAAEIKIRIREANKAWYTMAGLWTAKGRDGT